MTESPPLVLTILWTAWILQGVLSLVQVRKATRLFERSRRRSFEDYRPHAAVIVPFKGIDHALSLGIQALFTQAYPSYELLLVVESEDDPAYPLLKEALSQHPQVKTQILIAGHAGPTEGQKVRNQLCAIDHSTRIVILPNQMSQKFGCSPIATRSPDLTGLDTSWDRSNKKTSPA